MEAWRQGSPGVLLKRFDSTGTPFVSVIDDAVVIGELEHIKPVNTGKLAYDFHNIVNALMDLIRREDGEICRKRLSISLSVSSVLFRVCSV